MPSKHHVLKVTPKTRPKTREQLAFSLDVKSGKRERLRTTRRKQRALMVGIAVVALCMSVWGMHLLSYVPWVTIASVSVEGEKTIAEKNVQDSIATTLYDDAFHFFSPANIFFYPRTALEEKLSTEFPRFGSVSVARASMLSQAIVVTVEERKAEYRWCNTACYLMDSEGFIFAADDGSVQGGYEFGGALLPEEPIGQRFLFGRLKTIVTFLDELKALGLAPVGVFVENDKDFTVRTQHGYTIKAGFELDPQKVAKNIALVRASDSVKDSESNLEYIDTRFGNRVYYKMRE